MTTPSMPLKTRPRCNMTPANAPAPLEVATLRLKRHQVYPRGDLALVNPVANPRPGVITKETPIGAVGSCFASRLHDWLLDYGYNVVCAEDEPPADAKPSAREPSKPWRQTARFGVVHNPGALRMDLERALGVRAPAESSWTITPGDAPWLTNETRMDPYRHGVGWIDDADMRRDLEQHAIAVRDAFTRSSVFVMTLGLAEVWRSRIDNACFAGAPPKSVFDPARHSFDVLTVSEAREHIDAIYALMRSVNPDIQLVVTLSPVPLAATFRDQSCLVSDSASKAVLRVAIDEFCRAHPEVIYFPSYEIVSKMSEKPFEEDNRHVRLDVVERIMTTFMTAYGDLALDDSATA
jgi:hypothetical protein